uniref:Telomeric single stranded DNA binding POT1/Cdc13 domain-containing protein n=1 Tax=Graphocephala atropunctata TaxID=36148 RepID=A0A1B6MBY7_9HEMI
MEFKVLECEEPTLNCFCKELKKEGHGNLVSIEDSRVKGSRSIVMGKIVNLATSLPETKRVVIIAKEVLPNCEYGQKFKAVVNKELALALTKFSPETGDRLAFYEPVIYLNPSFEDKNKTGKKLPKYVVEIGNENKKCVMWAAKKQWPKTAVQGMPSNGVRGSQENIALSNKPSQTTNGFNKPFCKNLQSGVVKNSKNISAEKDIRPETGPSSKLATKQTRSSTQQLNPCYKYKNLTDIKLAALNGDFNRVNLFAVVREISKELSKTSTDKYTIICKITDESLGNRSFDLHFFVADDVLLKQIEVGDILRLHRVKMELFNDDVDGRIFNNNDIVIFKPSSMDRPLYATKNFQLTDAEKTRALRLRNWYKKFGNSITQLADIAVEGKYQIFCKILSKSIGEGNKMVLRVTDGSVLNGLLTSSSVPGESSPSSSVTDIQVQGRRKPFDMLKAGVYVSFPDIVATRSDALRLIIDTPSYQILDDQNEEVIKIIRRISELENPGDKVRTRTHGAGPEVSNSPVSTKHNDQTTNHPPDEGKDQTGGTRNCKKTNVTEEQKKNFSPCANNSCMRPKVTDIDLKKGNDCEEIEVVAVRKRRVLFNANSIDLSDATTEVSEVFENLNIDKNSAEEAVVNQGNTSFGDLLQLVRTKYCSPRKTSCQSSPITSPSKESSKAPATSNKEDATKINLQTAVVKLVKLSEEECKSGTSGSQANQEDTTLRTSRAKKRRQENNLEDASTVFNLSYQDNTLNRTEQSNKRVRLESVSTELGEGGENGPVVATAMVDEEATPQNGGEKVSNWLFHPSNSLGIKEKLDTDFDELDVDMAKTLLLGIDQDSPDLAKCLTSMKKRLRVFLVDLNPEPEADDLDLVSGYCFSGCRQIFLYSKLHWKTVDNQDFPLCPDCIQTNQEKIVELMLMMELHVFDANGVHSSILVCREHAEHFLRCSVQEYVEDEGLRRSRVRLLTDYSVKNTLTASITPMLDVTVTIIGKLLFLIDTRLKLPSSP